MEKLDRITYKFAGQALLASIPGAKGWVAGSHPEVQAHFEAQFDAEVLAFRKKMLAEAGA